MIINDLGVIMSILGGQKSAEPYQPFVTGFLYQQIASEALTIVQLTAALYHKKVF